MAKKGTKIIIFSLWLFSILVSIGFGIVIGITVEKRQPEQEEEVSIDTQYEDWKEFYDERIGLYFKYPPDCENITLEKADAGGPGSYFTSSKCDNNRNLDVNVNPTGDWIDTAEQEELITIDDQQLKIVWMQDSDGTGFLARIASGSGLKNIFSDSIYISFETKDIEDWKLYKKVLDSVKINQFYKDWETYEDKALGFFFKYPKDYIVDDGWIYDGIRVSTPDSQDLGLLIHINEEPQFLKKVHKDNYELITADFNRANIYKVKVYCVNQLIADDIFCSSEEPVSDYDSSEDKMLESIFYTQSIEEEGDYYYIGDFSKLKQNFAVEIYPNRDELYTYYDSFRYLELIINSIGFTNPVG